MNILEVKLRKAKERAINLTRCINSGEEAFQGADLHRLAQETRLKDVTDCPSLDLKHLPR